MGCSVSCQIFERFSSGLHWIGQYYMPEGLMFHILDDFLIVQKNVKFIWTSFYKFAIAKEDFCKPWIYLFLQEMPET
jgi:hypothetical protein